jgi:hypothetical protein
MTERTGADAADQNCLSGLIGVYRQRNVRDTLL